MTKLLKCGVADSFEHMLDLFQTLWTKQKVSVEWQDALNVPVPKKDIYQYVTTGGKSVCWMSLKKYFHAFYINIHSR